MFIHCSWLMYLLSLITFRFLLHFFLHRFLIRESSHLSYKVFPSRFCWLPFHGVPMFSCSHEFPVIVRSKTRIYISPTPPKKSFCYKARNVFSFCEVNSHWWSLSKSKFNRDWKMPILWFCQSSCIS